MINSLKCSLDESITRRHLVSGGSTSFVRPQFIFSWGARQLINNTNEKLKLTMVSCLICKMVLCLICNISKSMDELLLLNTHSFPISESYHKMSNIIGHLTKNVYERRNSCDHKNCENPCKTLWPS